MLNIRTKRHIRCARVETPTAWLVVAVLLETRGGETVAVSEPKVIKVIPKPTQLVLGGSYAKTTLFLAAPTTLASSSYSKILSPYVPNLGFAQSNIITGLAARPPTPNI